MSRKSKRGFKRLENHEMSEFSTLNGGGAMDSESEDLLDLTGDGEHDIHDRCGSCCCWGTCLYLVLLTFLVAILGVFCGYLMYNVWQINTDTSAAHKELKASVSAAEAHIDVLRKETGNRFIVVNLNLDKVNSSVAALESKVEQLSDNLDELRRRIIALESQPQEKLIQEVDNIHREMSILNQNMGLLNRSLEDVQDIRAKIASVGGVMDSYSAQFVSYSQQIGDVVQSNTDIRNDVIAADDKLKKFGDDLAEVKTSVSSSHDQMKQADDLLSAQLSQLQSMVSDLNDTVKEEVGQVWTNMTMVEAKLDTVEQRLSSIDEKIQKEQLPSSSTSPLPPGPHPPMTSSPDEPNVNGPPLATTTESISATESSLTTPPVATTTQRETTTKEGDIPSTTTGTGLPTGEPTTPLAGTSELPTGPVDEINGTAPEDGGFDEEGVAMTDESPTTVSSQDNLDEEEKNEKAIQALRIYIDNFDIMDRNSDGMLSPSEMGGANSQIFMLLDSNNDGYVTLPELQHMMNVLQSKHDTIAQSDNYQGPDSSYY